VRASWVEDWKGTNPVGKEPANELVKRGENPELIAKAIAARALR
jgi:hypothetical protein